MNGDGRKIGMKKGNRQIAGKVLLLTFAALATACSQGKFFQEKTALDQYIEKPDPSYSWQVVNTIKGEGYTEYVVDLKSQTWRTTADVDRTLWQHWLNIVKPDHVAFDQSLLIIGGGSNNDKAPTRADGRLVKLATETNSVVSELKMVPNQPLVYRNDGKQRSEDDSIGYTWDKVMTTGDPTWTLRMPMVKSAVRAMDTVQALMKSPDGGNVKINKFVVTGGSKRGWTTWLTGAVDRRVEAIIPIVIDVLNVGESMKHHYAAYGFWAPAVGDYVHHHIPERTGTPEHTALMKVEDPYSYRDRLTMPKLIMNASGDEFFLPDSSQFYFGDLKGVKYLRYVPNTKHGLNGSDAPESLEAFYTAIINRKPLPKFSWTKEADGSLVVRTTDKPKEVNLWQATNPNKRDFRLDVIGKAYQSSPVKDDGNGVYTAKVSLPPTGWTAFFVELVYDSGGKYPFKFTTEVSVIPDKTLYKYEPGKYEPGKTEANNSK